MSPFLIYVLLKLDGVRDFTIFISCSTCFCFVIAALCWTLLIDYEDRYGVGVAKKIIKFCLPSFILSMLLTVLIPTTKEAAAIYLIPKVVNNENIQNISSNTLHLLEEYTAELLKDMKDEATKKIKDETPKKDN